MQTPYLIGLFAGLAIVIIISIYLLLNWLMLKIGEWKLRRKPTSNHMTNWINQVDKHLKRRKIGLKATVYIGLLIFAVTIGITVGVIIKNPLAAVLLTLIGFVIPEQMVRYMMLRIRLNKFSQLVEACSIFVSELNRVNVTRALGNTGQSIPNPVGRIFRDVERNLIATNDPRDAFGKMMKELDFNYGRDFVTRVFDCYYNSAGTIMFEDLAGEMEEKRKRLSESLSKLFTDRLISIVVLLMFFPAYMIATAVVPTTWEFLTQTITGKIGICIYLLSIIIGPAIDYTTIQRLEV